MAVTGLNRPDFRTIADFRKRHLVALSDLFVQVLRLCIAADLTGILDRADGEATAGWRPWVAGRPDPGR